MSDIKLITGDNINDYLTEWAGNQLKSVGLPSAEVLKPCTCIGIVRQKKLIACAVYHGYQPYFGQIQMSFASIDPRWCVKGVLVALLEYPYRIGCHRIWVLTREDNVRIIRLLKGIGFIREGTLVGFFGSRLNAISWRMMRSDFQRFTKRIGREDLSGGERRQGQQRKSA